MEAKAEAATGLRGENLVSSFSGAGGAWLGLPVICSLVSLGVVSRKKKIKNYILEYQGDFIYFKLLFNAPELGCCGFGQLGFTDTSAQPFVLTLPFLSTSIPVGAP